MAKKKEIVKEVIKDFNKVSIADFIAKKIKKEKNKSEIHHIKVSSMQREFDVTMPEDDEILDYITDIGDGKDIKKVMQCTLEFFYRKCPFLQNTELHEALKIQDPYDVLKTFEMPDKQEIIEQFTKLMGMDSEKIDEEIKN